MYNELKDIITDASVSGNMNRVIDAAIIQIGKTIVVDTDLALDLLNTSKAVRKNRKH